MKLKVFIYSFLIICISGALLFAGLTTPKIEGSPPPPEMIIPVVGFKAVNQLVAEKISLVGNLEANEIVEIKSEIDGTVEEIKFAEGQKVKKGDPLILINQTKLNASLAQAEANLKLAETTSQRYQSLIESGAISRQEFEQATASLEINRAAVDLTKAQLRDSVISAPFDGTMGERLISVGQFIAKGARLSSVVNQDPIKANFRVPERYLSRVQENQAVQMRVAAYPEETFSGEVYFIDPTIDELTRTALVKARIPNSEGKLRHGMFASLELTVNEKPDAVVIPESSLNQRGDAVLVYTVNEDTTAAIKPVKVGIRFPGFVEITEGISAGEIVVVEGFQKLAPGVKTKVRFEETPLAPPQQPEELQAAELPETPPQIIPLNEENRPSSPQTTDLSS